jgi:hypothetical protein
LKVFDENAHAWISLVHQIYVRNVTSKFVLSLAGSRHRLIDHRYTDGTSLINANRLKRKLWRLADQNRQNVAGTNSISGVIAGSFRGQSYRQRRRSSNLLLRICVCAKACRQTEAPTKHQTAKQLRPGTVENHEDTGRDRSIK